MQEIKVPMVVTHDGDKGRMRARPMAAHLDPDANAIFFLTDAQAAKDKEIDLSDNVCLVFSDIRKQHYVSLTGRAELSDDRAKIKQLWSSLDSAFWTDENDPSIRVLKITPTIAEYWDHADAIASTVEMVKAALTGSRPDLRSNEKVELS